MDIGEIFVQYLSLDDPYDNSMIQWKTSPLVPYLMEDVQKIKNGNTNDLVWLLKHPSLFTVGLQSNAENIKETALSIFPIGQEG